MRTTVDIPDNLMEEALRTSHAKTKTTVLILGLKELIHRHHIEQLRALRGRIRLNVDVAASRKR